MKAIRIDKYGHSDEMKVENIQAPDPRENEILIEVHAVGVNPVDWKVREGFMKEVMPAEFPLTLGQDIAGRVIRIGNRIHGYSVGDDVYGFAKNGGYAEYVTAGEDTIARIPQGVDYVTAAAIPTAGLTAYQLVMKSLNLKQGQKVLIHGAGGGVGSFAVQLALWKKAEVFANASGVDVEYLRHLGVREIINHEEENFVDRVKEVDAVIDLVGGETLKKSYDLVKEGGIIASTVGEIDENLAEGRGLKGINFLMQRNSEDLAHMANLIEQEILRPRLNETLPLEEAKRALDELKNNHSKGKIVLDVRPS